MKLNWDYMAGFTDADGYIGLVGRGPRMTWGQKDREQIYAVFDFLEKEGLHPKIYFRSKVSRSKNGLYAVNLGRRAEVYRLPLS